MKKLIAISVVFALVAGAAFAQINVSGEVFARIRPLFGSNSVADKDKVHADGEFRRVRLEASGQDEDGKFGGYFRIDKSPWWLGSVTDSNYQDPGLHLPGDLATITGNAWWKPIDQLKLLFGGNGRDGFFGADGVTRWGFYQVAGDGAGVVNEDWRLSSSFYGGFDPLASLIITVTPIEALEINIGIPFWDHGAWDEAKDVYSFINAQVAYNIGGIGKLAITYAGNRNEGTHDGSKMYAYFGLSAIENLGLDIGVGFQFPRTVAEVTYNEPVAIGLGVNFGAGSFGIKARLQGEFGSGTKWSGGETKGPTVIDVDVLPSFAVTEKVSILLSAGMAISAPDKGDATVGWHINPYVAVKSNWWAPNFYAGVRIDSDGVKGSSGSGDASKVNWSIPIGITTHF